MISEITGRMSDMTEPIILELPGGYNFTFPEYENISEIPLLDNHMCDGEEDSNLYRAVVQSLVYITVFLLGVVGNGLLLTVLLWRHARLRVTEIYLLHLALADLLLLLGLPFIITQTLDGWVFGNVLCKLVGLLSHLNLVCGSLLLACISFDRYLAVVHAVSSLKSRRPRVVHLTCALLWLFSLGVTTPNVVFLSVKTGGYKSPQCYFVNHHSHAFNWTIASRFLTHLLCFFVPLVIMGYCYVGVVITLWRSKQSVQKQGAIRLAMVVTGAFCLCWMPYNITSLVDTLGRFDVLPETTCQARSALAQGLVLTGSLGYVHSCLNPILYAFVGVRFRSNLLQVLAKCGFGAACSSLQRARAHSRASVSETATTTTGNQNI